MDNINFGYFLAISWPTTITNKQTFFCTKAQMTVLFHQLFLGGLRSLWMCMICHQADKEAKVIDNYQSSRISSLWKKIDLQSPILSHALSSNNSFLGLM